MNYCQFDISNSKYYCDFNNSYYDSLQNCYTNCGLIDGNGNVVAHISLVDLTFVFSIWGVLLAVALLFAFYLSHD
jgi:hypothetical protein